MVVCALAASALAVPLKQDSGMLESVYDLYTSCSGEQDVAVCLKLKALGFVDRAARSAEISLVDGLKIVQNDEGKLHR